MSFQTTKKRNGIFICR